MLGQFSAHHGRCHSLFLIRKLYKGCSCRSDASMVAVDVVLVMPGSEFGTQDSLAPLCRDIGPDALTPPWQQSIYPMENRDFLLGSSSSGNHPELLMLWSYTYEGSSSLLMVPTFLPISHSLDHIPLHLTSSLLFGLTSLEVQILGIFCHYEGRRSSPYVVWGLSSRNKRFRIDANSWNNGS
jgi:hypothetical protein